MPLLYAHLVGPMPGSAGRVIIRRAAQRGMEECLAALLCRATGETGLRLEVNSVDTGKHSPNSRHREGRAVDLNRVSGRMATMKNGDALKLWRWFKAHDFKSGEREPGNAVLWGPVFSRTNPTRYPHDRHLHVSVSRAQVRKSDARRIAKKRVGAVGRHGTVAGSR